MCINIVISQIWGCSFIICTCYKTIIVNNISWTKFVCPGLKSLNHTPFNWSDLCLTPACSGFGQDAWTSQCLQRGNEGSRTRRKRKAKSWWKWQSPRPVEKNLWWALSCFFSLIMVSKVLSCFIISKCTYSFRSFNILDDHEFI